MPSDPNSALRTASDRSARRDFSVFIAGQVVSFVGTWMQKAAVGWLVWELTRSPAWVAAIALSDLIAALWVAPFAGAVADRNNPFRLILTTQSAMVALSLLLWWTVHIEAATVWFVMAWAVADATLQGFNQPVRMIAVASIVPRERMSQAIATNSIAANLARSTGPAIAGALIVHGSLANVFLANALSYFAMIAAVLLLRHKLDRPGLATKAAPMLRDVVSGFSYVRHTPQIAALFILTISFAVLARPFTELFPALAGQMLQGGPETLALLMSAQGIGALVGATWMLKRRNAGALVAITFGSAISIGIALLVFSFARTLLPLAVIAMAFAGLFHVVCNIGMQSLAQLLSEPAMRGRVVALYSLMFRAGPAVGALAIGVAAHFLPLHWLIGGAAGFFALGVAVALPKVRDIYEGLGDAPAARPAS